MKWKGTLFKVVQLFYSSTEVRVGPLLHNEADGMAKDNMSSSLLWLHQWFMHLVIREGIQVKALLDLNLIQFTQDDGLEWYNQQPPGSVAWIAN